jgi:hypothetical protein
MDPGLKHHGMTTYSSEYPSIVPVRPLYKFAARHSLLNLLSFSLNVASVREHSFCCSLEAHHVLLYGFEDGL